MGLNSDAVGTKTAPIPHSYTWRDVALYALGIGATADELDFVYERRGPRVFPTYAVVPAFAANEALFEVVGGDLSGVVHGSQRITLHKPFPSSGTVTTIGEVANIGDLKRMGYAVETVGDLPPPLPATEKLNAYLCYVSERGHGGRHRVKRTGQGAKLMESWSMRGWKCTLARCDIFQAKKQVWREGSRHAAGKRPGLGTRSCTDWERM